LSTDVIEEIVSFWLGQSLDSPEAAFARRDWWYDGGTAVDDEIRSRFGAFVPRACEGALEDWRTTPNGALALILLLDQFTRNIYRRTPEAYSGDARAMGIVKRAIDENLDRGMHPVARVWLYHPFHHAEQIEEQDRGIALLDALLRSAPCLWHPYLRRSVKGWTRHRNIVARFGRFPHRNAVLCRESTDEERRFLLTDGEAFGQEPRAGHDGKAG